MLILKKGHQPGVYVPLSALFLGENTCRFCRRHFLFCLFDLLLYNYIHGKQQVMSGWSVILTTLFLGQSSRGSLPVLRLPYLLYLVHSALSFLAHLSRRLIGELIV